MVNNMETKIIISPSIARQLLHKGNLIIDIKPNKKDIKQTVFVFEETTKLKEDLTSITK